MLLDEIKNIRSRKTELRKFGVTLGIFFALIAGLFLWRNKPHYIYLFGLSAFFLFFGLFLPIVLKPIQKIWMAFALIIGSIMTRVILSVLFYLVITPIGLLSRLSGKNFLDIKLDKSQNSYWIPRKILFNKTNYENQF